MFITLLLDMISYCISLLGFKGIHYFAKILSFICFDILRIRRSIMLQNLDIVFGNTKTMEQKKNIARNSLTSFFSTILEFFASKKLFPKAKINFVNKTIIESLISQNKGLYAICIHMSNWELLCSANAKKFAPIHVVVKAIGKGSIKKWVEKVRTNIGFSLIERNADTSATTQIFNALNKSELIGFIVDQKRPRGEYLPFFSKTASTNNGLIKLYLRKKAPIMPAIIKRKNFGEFDIIYFPEFIVEEKPNLSIKDQISYNTKRMNLVVEKMILENPDEYFWMHNRWNLKK